MTNTKEALYAKMYAWLRQQHWSNSPMAVVMDPKRNVELSAYCPSEELLDEKILTALRIPHTRLREVEQDNTPALMPVPPPENLRLNIYTGAPGGGCMDVGHIELSGYRLVAEERVKPSPAALEKCRALLLKHGICEDCGEMYSHDIDAPFASCNCKQSEWYELTPYMKLQKRLRELGGQMPSGLKGTRCKHNVLWPHECKECADEIPLEIIGTWETPSESVTTDATVEALQFALGLPDGSDGLNFLRLWNEGEFEQLREGYPEAPESIYIGADPLHPKTMSAQEKAAAIVAQWPEWKRNYQLTKHGSPALAAHNPELPNNQQGLYQKFLVTRTDGSDQPGGKHHGCTYFVLDLVHDKHAPSALAAYSESCRETHPELSADLDMLFSESPSAPETFAVTYIERREGGPMLFRRSLSDWPEWAEPLKKAVEEQPTKKYMPIHSTHLSIPMEMLNEEWARKNHNQSLNRLAERGGLAAYEALDIIKRQRFVYGNTKKNTLEFLEWVVKQTAPVPVPTSERLPTEADADCDGDVAAITESGIWHLLPWSKVDGIRFTHWQRTGLTRSQTQEAE